MSAIRFFLDEDIYGAISTALQNRGVDGISTPEVERRGESDESQLEWAAAHGRVLVTFNVAHFAKLHGTWMKQGRHHAGIVVSSQRPIGDLLGRMVHLAKTLNADVMLGRLEFLSDW